MSRIVVPEIQNRLFETEIIVQIADINYGNHVSNDAILRMCHEVRMRWLASLQWSEMDAGGSGLIMLDAAVQYLAQGHHGDVLRVVMGCNEINKIGFELLYAFERVSDGKCIARVQTGMACFDYQRQKMSRLSVALKSVLEAV